MTLMNDLAIVIPAYKKDYLYDALESLNHQTCKDFHVYICDDASPHDLEPIVKQFEGELPLSYHRFENNLGSQDLVGQWKRSIDCSIGEKWIWLFSDDDIMEPRCVESFYKSIKDHPEGELFHFNLKIRDEFAGGGVSETSPFPISLSAGEYLEAKLRGRIISYVVEFVFNRALYHRIGGFLNFDLAWGSDFLTWLLMASQTPKGIITIDDPQAKVVWRRSPQNISPDISRPIMKRKLKSLIKNASFIKDQLKKFPNKYSPLKYSFRWIRFPLGEIMRNKRFLTPKDTLELISTYFKEVILK